jgi:outer membrane protein assembly factor BamB
MPDAFSNAREVRGAKTLARAHRPAAAVRLLLLATASLAAAAPALSEHTRWWRQSTFEEFDKGTAKGVAVRSDGKLFLAPRFAEFADASLAYLLRIRADSKGNLYAAGGSNAKVLRIDANGKSTSVFESSELAAQALTLDAAGNLFVGTSPDGKVYKVTPAGQKSVFFEPKTKYIWDLAVDKDGTVYVATGDGGKIFAVAPDGKGQVFYTSEETHIRSLGLDSNGNVLAGTEPSGQVLRIPKAAGNRHAFVLYETAKKEITSLLQAADGSLYVASVGEKTPPPPGQPRPQPADVTTVSNFVISMGQAGTVNPAVPQVQPVPFTPFPTVNSSSVYRIAPDGSPEEIWSARDQVVYSMGLLPGGKLLLGTGNEGAVLELEGNHIFSKLAKASSRQVTSIAAGPDGKLFLAAANPGKVLVLGPDNEPEGTFESQPFDAHIFSRWGRTAWWGENVSSPGSAQLPDGRPRVLIYARSGNTSDPDSNWSDWAGPYSNPSGDKLDCPPARFVQWKAVLRSGSGKPAPTINWFSIAYLPKNIAPEITAIALQDPGVRVQGISLPATGPGAQANAQLRMPQPPPSSTSPTGAFATVPISNLGQPSSSAHFDPAPQGFVQKGYQSVLWTADDTNDDQLEFSVYFRGENETSWKLLKDKLDVRYYSWDTATLPDGAYYLKIVASDAPSNPAGEGLTTERESERFVVSNTPPEIAQLTADAARGAGVRVRFQASAPVSFIARAQYSLDAGEWTLVFPTGGLSDSPRESYDFQLQKVPPGEHTITVRVYDQFENISTAKATVRVGASGN